MKKSSHTFFILLGAIALGAFIVFAPPILKDEVKRDAYFSWFTKNTREWEGIIRIWNIKDDTRDVGRDFLTSRAKAYEKAHKGVFLELTHFTAEQAQIKLQSGIAAPDVWFYAQGMELGIACDIAFEMLTPKDETTIVSDFEFDVTEQGVQTPEVATTVFCAGIAASDPQKAAYAREFALEVAQKAADMLY